jgi:hypothetical protein
MSFRTDSLYERLTTAQVDVLMPAMKEAKKNRVKVGLDLCTQWGVKTSVGAVHNCFTQCYYGWALERSLAAAKFMSNFTEIEAAARQLTAQKLLVDLASVDCPPNLLVAIRSLEIEQDKLDLATRSAETRFKLEKEKLTLADRRVKLLEAKMQKASDKLKELRDPKKADDAETRKAILDRVDELMGIKSAEGAKK